MELQIDNDQFLSFARRSKEVQRTCEEDVPQAISFQEHNDFPKYDEEFWDRIVHQPSDESLQVNCSTSPRGSMNSKVVTRGQASGRRRGEALGPIVEQLPSPAELMQHRQKGKRSAEVQRAPALQPKMAAVLHHIGDLKRRQSSIDLLKRNSWWSNGNTFGPTEDDATGHKDLTETRDEQCLESFSRDSLKETPMEIQDIPHTYTNAALYSHKNVFPGCDQMPSLAPGGNPMMAFVLASADRQSQRAWQSPGLPQEQLWGFENRTGK
ncbi:protein INCA1 isoform X2 [Clupea harengus]|uniref:Protein INCA1 isoform X2 n=1 Tax=Clupea harengus TaxID=7950 RepID=A0A6P8FLM4_CLUHA|nr:protein INCA1 isoform X2 [Clupea harengus]